jgi:hypothetical protein
LRGHLGWVVLLTIVTVTAALIIRAVADDRAAHEVALANTRAAAAVPARMATFGYRPARWGNDYMLTIGLAVGQYAYCQPSRRCDTRAGNVSHPPVDLLSGGLIGDAYIWWPSGPLSVLPQSVCMTSARTLSGGISISSSGWSAGLSRLAQQVRRRIVDAILRRLRDHADIATAIKSAEGYINVDGWRCAVP